MKEKCPIISQQLVKCPRSIVHYSASGTAQSMSLDWKTWEFTSYFSSWYFYNAPLKSKKKKSNFVWRFVSFWLISFPNESDWSTLFHSTFWLVIAGTAQGKQWFSFFMQCSNWKSCWPCKHEALCVNRWKRKRDLSVFSFLVNNERYDLF